MRQAVFPGLDTTLSHQSKKQTTVEVQPPADVLDTLAGSPNVEAVILDPWYNKGIDGERDDYNDWLTKVIRAACRISEHVFVWGFPEILAYQIAMIPYDFKLVSWLTWYCKNCPSVIRGWRSAQNTCLHLAANDASIYPEHFLNADQLARWKAGKMRFVPGPPSVLEAPLNIGFVGRSEQTGHPAQKPLSVIEPLLLMATKELDTVLDPMCGSGTTGEACLRLVLRHSIIFVYEVIRLSRHMTHRSGSEAAVAERARPWAQERNRKQIGVDWQFTAQDARTKLKRLYPKIKT